MKKFTFNLDTLLRTRKEAENAAQRKLLEAHIHLQNMFKILGSVEKEYMAAKDVMSKKEESSFFPDEMSSLHEYILKLENKITGQIEEVVKAQIRVEDIRQIVLKAMHEKKVLENFKEKEYTTWKEDILNQETLFDDEVSTTLFIRDKKEKDDANANN